MNMIMQMPDAFAVPDATKLGALVERLVVELGPVYTAPLVVLGDKLGLYRALAQQGPLNAPELARLTGTYERYVHEWLNAQAAAGYVTYDPAGELYGMTPEQAAAFADEDSPAFMIGGFQTAASMASDRTKLEAAFKHGHGVGWHEHHDDLYCGVSRMFRASYLAHLVSDWLPALDGVVERLTAGARVADIGCGHGASTIIMAQAFPGSQFFGFDYHPESIALARQAAAKAGLAERVSFEVAPADAFPGEDFDLVTTFDALHDMGDPASVARHVRSALKPQGTWMVIEPLAGDRVEENLNPVGRLFYAASAMICTPGSTAQAGAMALGAQAGPERMLRVMAEGGFNRVRKAMATEMNMVLEARH